MPSTKSAGETVKEGGGGAVSVSNVLSGGGTGIITLWCRDLGLVGGDAWKLEWVHMGLLRQIIGQREKRKRERTWQSTIAEKFIKEAVIQSLGKYIDKRQKIVAEWVLLRPILEVCNKETGYEGGGRRWDPWWRQTAATKQLISTLKRVFYGGKVASL